MPGPDAQPVSRQHVHGVRVRAPSAHARIGRARPHQLQPLHARLDQAFVRTTCGAIDSALSRSPRPLDPWWTGRYRENRVHAAPYRPKALAKPLKLAGCPVEFPKRANRDIIRPSRELDPPIREGPGTPLDRYRLWTTLVETDSFGVQEHLQ